MKILLFGSKGQVGREIVDLTAIKKIDCTGYDIDQVDMVNESAVIEAVKVNQDANIVINAAAYTAVDQAEDEPELAEKVNADAVLYLAKACKTYNLPLIHISTDYVFKGDANTPYQEDDVPTPVGVYGKTKLKGEELLRENLDQHLILRVSWVFGQYGKNFVKTMIRLAKDRETLKVVDDQRGCPTSAADIARVLVEIAKQIHEGNHHFGTYHYCGNPEVTWYGFAKVIIEEAKKVMPLSCQEILPITTAEFPTKATRPAYSTLSMKKLQKDYGIESEDWESHLLSILSNFTKK